MEPQASTRPERSTLDEFLGRQPASARMRLLRKAAPVIALLLLAGLAFLYFTGRNSDQPDYATAPVQRGDLRVTVSATGNLQPYNMPLHPCCLPRSQMRQALRRCMCGCPPLL